MKIEEIIKALMVLKEAENEHGIWEIVINYKAVRKLKWPNWMNIDDDDVAKEHQYETHDKNKIPEDAYDITYILRDGSDGNREMEITEEQFDSLNELINTQKEDFNFLRRRSND